MPGYADVEDPKALLAQDPGLAGGATVEDAIADAGFQVQAVNWVWEKVVGEDLVSSIITPITGDFEQIARAAAQWNNVRDALQAVRNNLNGGLEELQPSWQGEAAERFYQLIGTTWTLGIEADAQAAKLIGIALSKVADGSKRACDQILDLIEKLVNKLIEAAAMLPIPVVGWGRAVKLVYDGIQIYNAIMSLIEGIQQIIEGAQQVISGITSVGTALSKLGSADSLNDLINVGNEAGQGIADTAGGVSSIRDGATQVSSSATDLSDSANSARDNARGLADERASARDQTSTSGTDSASSTSGSDSTTTDRPRSEGESPARPDDPDSTRTQENDRVCENDPVDIASGEVVLGQTDVELPGMLPLVLKRTHISSYRAGQAFGRNWASTFDQRLEFDRDGVVFVADDGMILVYPEPSATEPVLPRTGPRWPLSRTPTGWAVTRREIGQTLHFTAGEHTIRRLTAITDRNDNRIDFDRDPIGTVTAVRHHGGYHIDVDTERGEITELRLRNASGPDIVLVRYRYHDSGFLAEVVNSSNRALRFTYDPDGRLTQWTDRNGQWYRYLYDGEGRCIANQGSGGFLNGTFTYDRAERTTRFTDALGHATVYRLNERGNVIARTDPLGHTTTSEWDEHDRLVATTDPLGRATHYEYDHDGNLLRRTRPDGSQITAQYNELGLPVHVTNADGSEWHPEYDARGNLLAETDPAGARVSYRYDDHGRLTAIGDALGQEARVATNAAGLITSVTTATGDTTRYERDAFGRPSLVTDPRGGQTGFGWTVEGKLIWRRLPDGATERWAYDGEDNLTEYADQNGNVTSIETTSFDLPAARVEPDGRRLSFSYDPALRLTAVTNSLGQVWRYSYDAAGRLVSETDFDGRTLRYGYDAAGQLVERTNGAGQTTALTRNVLGHVVEQRCGEQVTEFSYDALGRLLRAANADSELTFERDAQGRVVAESCAGRVVRSTYDQLGRRVRRVTPSGAESSWEYDANDQPTALHTAGRTVRFRYDSAGREVERSVGAANLTQTWDASNRLLTQTVSVLQHGTPADVSAAHQTMLQRRAYHYRPDGYVSGVDDHLGGARRFTLDPAGRITNVTAHGWTERYLYDPQGNITDGQWSGGRQTQAGTVNRTGNVHYRYDPQGRVVMRQRKRLSSKPDTWHYTWDGQDRLIAVVTPDGQHWRYTYDALGRRLAKRRYSPDGATLLTEVLFTWDGFVLAEQTESHPDGTSRCTAWDWERDRFSPITQIERVNVRERPQEWIDEQFYAIVTDLVGSPAELIDADGELAWKARTTIWGAELAPAGRMRAYCPFRFPGQYHDDETGLNYNFHRHYDPETGSYASLDPLGLAPAPNPRTYVHNPVNSLDPLGLAPPCQDAVGAARTEADDAQSQHPSGKTRPTAAAALVVEGHDPVTGTSTKGTTDPDYHPRVQEALDRVPEEQRSPSHGRCAEPAVISNALNSGVNPSGGTMAAVEVRAEGNPRHGDVKPPCSSCQNVLDQFGISAVR